MPCIEWAALAHNLEIFETLPEVFEWTNSLDKPDLLELRGTSQAHLRRGVHIS